MFFSCFFGFFKLTFTEISLTKDTILSSLRVVDLVTKMDFILNEAVEESEDFKLVFSDDSGHEEELGSFVTNEEDEMFIDDE